MAEASPASPSIEVGDLLTRADAGDALLLLDVRNDDEFDAWRFEARRPIETMHIPYFNFIEDAQGCIDRLPREREIVVLCAQGGSSAMVVDTLREAGLAAHNVAGGMVTYGEYLKPVKVPIPVADAPGWELWQINRRGKGCLSYIVRAGLDAIVVDPSRDVQWYEGFVQTLGARIVQVLDTHVHADHLSGAAALARRGGVPYFVQAGEGFELRQPVESLGDGRELRVGGDAGVTVHVRIMTTPGHTPGSCSYLIGRRHLLTGDTLFVKSVGRPDLGGDVVEWGRALFRTLRERLATVPDDTVILPAHFAGLDEMDPDGVVAAPLARLRREVPELDMTEEETFLAAMRAALKPAPASYAEIIRANLGLTTVDPETATEWELGKNQCAARPMPAVS